jgi:hypothetical protein
MPRSGSSVMYMTEFGSGTGYRVEALRTRYHTMQKRRLVHIGKLLRDELNAEPKPEEWLEALTRQLYVGLEGEQKLRRRKIRTKAKR